MSKIIETTWKVVYKNYKGVIANRKITIKDIFVGSTSYHPKLQLLLSVYDHDRKALRDYSAKDVIEWLEKID